MGSRNWKYDAVGMFLIVVVLTRVLLGMVSARNVSVLCPPTVWSWLGPNE